ncbi:MULTISPECIES: O-methyltransferase [Enterobacteriaceae]|jgi:predicted O-methyltransferase YrrM|uniref:O-methyltransferase n=1 Tax=Phytobacter diazotrophicus TaxID=395631 RepID=A0ABM7VVU0_9ENTR|nr:MULTISPECIES: O-methyltransferase [Phytobacter]MDU4152082.1 O-methyltransferase [Enterobacteriaceae bacterium]PTA96207.1 O-methyltransferase [Kluyvera sp. Nf5]PXW61293.1 putative O-methyltransferase YrrM [Grimontella sp. AG753]MDC0726700.1 O-methyltransferase [Phytobacter diazotrophicus]MDC0734131.1 O-methyltransferase [Phytobacter diazotrophicus]
MQKQWSNVDNYLIEKLIPKDDILEQVLVNNQQAGLPAFDVAANQGQLLALFVRMTGAKRILEIGTLGGYSTIWMARELPTDGELLTLEADAHHASIARQNLQLAGVAERVKLIEGPALNSLEQLGEHPPFDLIFIDADKPSNPDYLRWALRYSRPGTLIIGDNVVRDGEVTNPQSDDARVQGVRTFIEMLGEDPRLTATAIQTVGVKGWDGFTLAWVNA